MLRSNGTGVSTELAEAVDAALAAQLADIAGIERPTISPVDYAEIQLTVGCQDQSRACLETIAQTAQVEAIVVRRLTVEPNAGTSLELIYFDARAGEPKTVRANARANASAELSAAMPGLLRELFELSSKPAPASDSATAPVPTAPVAAPQPQRSQPLPPPAADGGIGALTWVVLGTGVAALGSGVVLGALGKHDFAAYKSAPVRTRADADRANAEFDAAHTKGTLANVLMPVGAVALAVGATLLVLDVSSKPDDGDRAANAHARLSVTPLFGGGVLTLSGPLESSVR